MVKLPPAGLARLGAPRSDNERNDLQPAPRGLPARRQRLLSSPRSSRWSRARDSASTRSPRRAASARASPQEMLKQRRGLSRLLPARHHHGLARPRLGRRADRRRRCSSRSSTPLGMPQSALHFTSFLVGFLVFSSLHIVLGEQVPKTLAIREPEPVSLWIAYPLHAVLPALLSR